MKFRRIRTTGAVGIAVVSAVGFLPATLAGASPSETAPPDSLPKDPAPANEVAVLPPAPVFDPASPSEKGGSREPQPLAPLGSVDWIETSDDSVIDSATYEAMNSGPYAALFYGNGFNGFGLRNYGDYRIRLMTSAEGNIESLRADLTAVATQVNALVGTSIQVDSNTYSGPSDPVQLAPGAGEIDVIISSTSGCSGTNWAGCGGTRGYRSFAGVGHYTGGVLWIHPDTLGYSSNSRRHVVEHEIGHSLGLAHYDSTYNGSYQVMNSSQYPTNPGYFSGDQNGIWWLQDTPPANDRSYNAQAVGPAPVTVVADTWFATKDASEQSHGGNSPRRSVWYRYDPAAEQNGLPATIWTSDPSNGGFDTTLAVYSGTSAIPGTLVAENDDFNQANSSVTFAVDATKTYWIAIDGYSWARGTTQVNFDFPIIRPPNDNFAAAFTLNQNGSATGTNEYGTLETSEYVGTRAPSQSVWWEITLSQPGEVELDTVGSDFDTTVEVFRGGTSAASPGATQGINDDDIAAGLTTSRLSFVAEAGVTYYIRVDGFGSYTGSIVLNSSTRLASTYTAITPKRILDTRNGTGILSNPLLGFYSTTTPMCSGCDYDVRVAGGSTTVPLTATAVVVNLTVTQPTSNGYATLYPPGQDRPNASSVNWQAGRTVANQAIVPVANDRSGNPGYVRLYNSAGTSHGVLDVVGYFSDFGTSRFTPVAPARLMDTRSGYSTVAAPMSGGEQRTLDVGGRAGIPAGATAAILNVTVTGATSSGWLSVFGSGGTRPLASTVNWATGVTVANHAIAPLGSGGAIDVYVSTAGSTEVIVDVVGWFGSSGGSRYLPISPVRIMDSRNDTGTTGSFSAGESRSVSAQFLNSGSYTAVAMNLTATRATTNGYATAWAAAAARPNTSNLNWQAGVTRANLTTTPTNGQSFSVRNSAGTTDLIGDVAGAYLVSPS